MKYGVTIALACGLIAAGCQDGERRRRPEDVIIASVDGKDVTRGAWDAYLRYSIHLPDEPLAAGGEREFPPEVRSRILDRFLVERALVSRAAAIAEITDTDLDRFAAETGLGTLAEIYESMPITQRDYVKTYLRESLVVRRLLQAQSDSGTGVSDAEARAYFEANPTRFEKPAIYRLRTIRLESLRDTEEAKKEIGGDATRFVEVATRLSSDEDEQGRSLGGWTLARMPEPFAEAIAPLETGQVSAVAQDPDGGYNIFLVEEKIQPEAVSFEAVKARIVIGITRERRDHKSREIITQAEQSARIELFPENLDFEYSSPSAAAPPTPTPSSSGGA